IDPEARDILLLGDESETFQAIRQEIVTELERHPKIQAHFLSSSRIEPLVEALRSRHERFVFLTTLGKMTDAAGRTLTLPETISAIVHAGSFIIISMEDVYLYPGVLGGYVTSGFKQGEAAAGMVLRYLSGTAVSDIPPIETSPNEYIFDSKELSRIGVKLPPEIARLATILNPLPTFYERNLHVIVRTLYALALLFVLSLSIFLYLVLRKNRQITESEEKHRILFEGSPDAYLILAHGVITDCNRATQAMLRGDRKEIIGQTPASLSPELQPDGRKSSEVVDEKIGEVLRTGRQTFDWMNRRLDKTDFWVEVTISLMTMQGLPVLFIALRDITERKHAAAAILQAKNDWEDTFNSINDVITVHDNNFNIILANKAAEKLGWNPARGAKQNVKCFKFFHDTENPPPNCVTCQCLETGCPAVFELYEPRFDKHLEIRAIPRLDSNNRLAGSIHIARDITARKLAEAEIQRLVSAIEQTRETVKIMSPDGAVQYINRAVEQSTGKTRGEIIGKNIFDNELVSDNLREIWRSVSEGRVWSGRLAQELNGIAYEFEFTMTPVFDATGTLTSIISIGRDVTHEKKLEEQLLQSQKMQAIGTLAGGIAHDFNNMLTGIIGFAEIAKDKVAQDSRPVYYLEQILKLSQRAASLVQQILVFSRKAGSIHTPMQLSPLLKEVLTLLRATLPTTIEIRQKLLDQGSLVEADPTQIHQVLMNLCINAAHAMEEQGGALEIELTRVSLSHDDILPGQDIEPGPHVFLKVSDTGTGIDPAIISRIFDPFFTTKDVGRGTGLGLSVVHGIIKDHRGDIAVTSEQGKGTTFLILLPEVSAPAESIRAKDNMEPLSGTEHILFVDDEDALTGLAKELLEPLGYRVTAAQSGQEAWELFQKTPEQFDLVITDLTMPHMTGYELA
ncbi:MAG: PAS domain S-box protein, partial [Pseudomonadota bacterium]